MSEEESRSENPTPMNGDEETSTFSKAIMPSWAIVALAIVALFGVLIAVMSRGNRGSLISSSEINQLEAEAMALREQLNRERASIGLRPLEGGTESVQDIASRLKRDADTMVALSNSFQSMVMQKDAEIASRSSDLIRSEQLRQSLAAECSRLQTEFQKALVSSSEGELLRSRLAQLVEERDALVAELAAARANAVPATGMVPVEDLENLQRQLEELRRANQFYEARVGQLEGAIKEAKLFARSENELLPAAVELFRTLRSLEGKPDSEISSAYSSIGASIGANVLHTLKFATGSSELTKEDNDLIQKLVNEIPDGDLVLVIGYASETGNVEANQKLSSDRATVAAELFSSLKRPEQKVQAVYLGQTDRFSSRIPERNQIVEIWHLRKK